MVEPVVLTFGKIYVTLIFNDWIGTTECCIGITDMAGDMDKNDQR